MGKTIELIGALDYNATTIQLEDGRNLVEALVEFIGKYNLQLLITNDADSLGYQLVGFKNGKLKKYSDTMITKLLKSEGVKHKLTGYVVNIIKELCFCGEVIEVHGTIKRCLRRLDEITVDKYGYFDTRTEVVDELHLVHKVDIEKDNKCAIVCPLCRGVHIHDLDDVETHKCEDCIRLARDEKGEEIGNIDYKLV